MLDRIFKKSKLKSNQKKCNCKDSANCPLNSNYLMEYVIYKTREKSDKTPEKVYTGSTEGTLK